MEIGVGIHSFVALVIGYVGGIVTMIVVWKKRKAKMNDLLDRVSDFSLDEAKARIKDLLK